MANNGRTHLFVTDAHAKPGHDNSRADLIGKLIVELRPDVVVVGGDTADFPSLSSYDKGKKSFQGRTYANDVGSHNEFQDRIWSIVRRSKRKLPRRVTLIGNHEQRIDRAVDAQPELEGVISYRDLDLDKYYDTIVPYTGATPGGIIIDGIYYSHYIVSGISGRPISGENPASALISKRYSSCTVGHSHLVDWSVKTQANGKKIMATVGGCFVDYEVDYAGDSQKFWTPGVVIKRNVDQGMYDFEFVSLRTLKDKYKK